jgi:uncharacterized membrane protein YbhN (UPF0104 family)
MTDKLRYQTLQVIKILVFVLMCFLIGYHVRNRVSLIHDFNRLLSDLQTVRVQEIIFIVFLLMILNWTIESFKWIKLVTSLQELSFLKSLRGVLTGVTVSFFTPNRIGEFAGKIVHLKTENRVKGALLAFIGSSAQLLITIQAGLIALALEQTKIPGLENPYNYTINIILIFSSLILTLFWFNIPAIFPLVRRFKWSNKYVEYFNVFNDLHWKELWIVYLLSLFRYFVFSTQNYLLLSAFGVEIPFAECLMLTSISFLLITAIPSISFGELGIRGGVNLAIFTTVTQDSTAILISTFSLWFINLVVPAILGAVSVLYIRIRK